MTYSLTISSQGQIIIPSKLWKYLGVQPKDKLRARQAKRGKIPIVVVEPPFKQAESQKISLVTSIISVSAKLRRENKYLRIPDSIQLVSNI